MALGWYKRDMVTPGFPVVTLTEAQWRARVAQYIPDVDNIEFTVMVADQHWVILPGEHLWMSTTGTFNPTTNPQPAQVNSIPTHRQNNRNVPGSKNN